MQTSTLKKLVILNSPAQTVLHFPVILIFCPGRQRVIGVIIIFDKILQFTLLTLFPVAQIAAPTFMHLPVFPLHSPGRHGDNSRFGLYIAGSPTPSPHKSSVKAVVDLIPDRRLCTRALVFTMSMIVYASVKIKIIFEPQFILTFRHRASSI